MASKKSSGTPRVSRSRKTAFSRPAATLPSSNPESSCRISRTPEPSSRVYVGARETGLAFDFSFGGTSIRGLASSVTTPLSFADFFAGSGRTVSSSRPLFSLKTTPVVRGLGGGRLGTGGEGSGTTVSFPFPRRERFLGWRSSATISSEECWDSVSLLEGEFGSEGEGVSRLRSLRILPSGRGGECCSEV